MSSVDELRAAIRERVWRLLEERGVARPPFPVRGRIPNYAGAREAALLLAGLPEWRRARTVKVNPDSPQRYVRLQALREGKILVMPTPRIRRGFLLLDPSLIPREAYGRASTIRGAFRYGRLLDSLDIIESGLPPIDFIVEGSVAVDRRCNRLGKGEGYGDLEYALLYLLGKAGEETPVATTVHELQIVEEIPSKPHDLPLDIVVTPRRVYRCPRRERPRGLVLSSLSEEKVREIPILREALRRYYQRRGGGGG